ncbi:hypothetical protein QYF36_021226 [Acer negundo]|nr:hypothetical protein QYF36_021226 [Acer negundo]
MLRLVLSVSKAVCAAPTTEILFSGWFQASQAQYQTPDPSTQFNFTHSSYEGSSIGLNPSNKHPSFDSNYSYVTTQNEAFVEVNQIGESDFLIKYNCEQKWGGFARLMKSIHSLGLQTIEVNVTISNGMVLKSLKVEIRLVAVKAYALFT